MARNGDEPSRAARARSTLSEDVIVGDGEECRHKTVHSTLGGLNSMVIVRLLRRTGQRITWLLFSLSFISSKGSQIRIQDSKTTDFYFEKRPVNSQQGLSVILVENKEGSPPWQWCIHCRCRYDVSCILGRHFLCHQSQLVSKEASLEEKRFSKNRQVPA